MRITFQREHKESSNNHKEDRISLEPVPPPKGILYYNSPLKELSLQYNWGLDTQAWWHGIEHLQASIIHTSHTLTTCLNPPSQGLKHHERWRELAGRKVDGEEEESLY